MDTNCIFPIDLVEEILARMPIKDLLRMRCVSKGWCALIDDASFIKKHYQVQYSFRKLDDNMTYFVAHIDPLDSQKLDIELLSVQHGNAFTVEPLTADLKRASNAALPYGADDYKINFHCCVNGIICLTCESRKTWMADDSFLALWNPATREFKTLAYPNDLRLIHTDQLEIEGFGFDQSSSDFKILGDYLVHRGYRGYAVGPSNYLALYSLKSNSWKWISCPPGHLCRLPMATFGAYLNGVYYWVTEVYQECGWPRDLVIVSFNFTTEVFKVSDLPDDAISLLESAPYYKAIVLYRECLALTMSFKVPGEASYNIHIWVAIRLDDYGVPLSWQHLFTIGYTPAKLGLSVCTILMNGDLQLASVYGERSDEFEGLLYNHSTGEFKKFDIWWDAWLTYVESLFPLSKRLVQT